MPWGKEKCLSDVSKKGVKENAWRILASIVRLYGLTCEAAWCNGVCFGEIWCREGRRQRGAGWFAKHSLGLLPSNNFFPIEHFIVYKNEAKLRAVPVVLVEGLNKDFH